MFKNFIQRACLGSYLLIPNLFKIFFKRRSPVLGSNFISDGLLVSNHRHHGVVNNKSVVVGALGFVLRLLMPVVPHQILARTNRNGLGNNPTRLNRWSLTPLIFLRTLLLLLGYLLSSNVAMAASTPATWVCTFSGKVSQTGHDPESCVQNIFNTFPNPTPPGYNNFSSPRCPTPNVLIHIPGYWYWYTGFCSAWIANSEGWGGAPRTIYDPECPQHHLPCWVSS